MEPSDEQTENTTPQATAEPSATKPVQPTEPSDEAKPDVQAEGEEPIEVTVTATRTEESVDKIPRSVTVITREQIEDQSRFTRNLTNILGRTVPGFSPPTNRTNTFGSTLHGRSIKLGAGELLIGIQNLLNEQYFPVYAQYFAPFDDSSNYAGQGRTLSVGYRIT